MAKITVSRSNTDVFHYISLNIEL